MVVDARGGCWDTAPTGWLIFFTCIHIQDALLRAGLVLEACQADVLRQEAGLPVAGWVVTAGLPGPAAG